MISRDHGDDNHSDLFSDGAKNGEQSAALSETELLQLQQLIAHHNEKQQQTTTEKEQQQQSQLQQQEQHVGHSSSTSSDGRTKRPHMENNVDPLWYLVYGPLIIFPPDQLSKLTLNDMVEYYRAYPTMHWSKYPRLYDEIVKRLTERERTDLRLMEEECMRQRQVKKRFYRFYVRYVRYLDFWKLLQWLYRLLTNIWWWRYNGGR